MDCQPIPAGGREPYLKTSAAGALSAPGVSRGSLLIGGVGLLPRPHPGGAGADTREDGVGSDQSAYVVEHLDARQCGLVCATIDRISEILTAGDEFNEGGLDARAG